MLPLLAFALSIFVAIDMQQKFQQRQEEQRREEQYQQRQYQQRQYQQRQYQQRQEQLQYHERIMWTAVSAAAGGFVGLIYLHSK